LLNNALIRGDIVTVVPIIAAAPVFTMLMSWLIFRREKITARTLAALALVLPSVILIVVLGHR
jgi:DME family drug/metabolite transporter